MKTLKNHIAIFCNFARAGDGIVLEKLAREISQFAPSSIPALVQALKENQHHRVQREIVRLLGSIDANDAADAVAAEIPHPDVRVSLNLCVALAALKDVRAVPFLLTFLNADQLWMKREAIRALGNLADNRALDPLLRAFRSDDWNIASSTALALQQCGARAAVPLASLLQDNDADVRARAAVSLGRIGDGVASEKLLPLLRDECAMVRASALNAMGRLRASGHVEAIKSLADDPEPYVRQSVAQALGEIDGHDSYEVLIHLIGDQDVSTRSAAIKALGKLRNKASVPALIRILNEDPHPSVRIEVAASLGRIGDPSSLPALSLFHSLVPKLLSGKKARKKALRRLRRGLRSSRFPG